MTMTEATQTSETENGNPDLHPDLQMPSELEMLKKRATLMGLKFSNNIGLESLKARVEAKIAGEPDPQENTSEVNALDEANEDTSVGDRPETKQEIRARLQRDCLKLVRLRITNLDPKKKDLPGEIFTVANEYLGTIRKYIPYGEVTDNGYHVPQIIYDEMKARKFLNIRTNRKGGQIHVEQNWAQEFALEVLPNLTEQELARLAASQAAAGGLAA